MDLFQYIDGKLCNYGPALFQNTAWLVKLVHDYHLTPSSRATEAQDVGMKYGGDFFNISSLIILADICWGYRVVACHYYFGLHSKHLITAIYAKLMKNADLMN